MDSLSLFFLCSIRRATAVTRLFGQGSDYVQFSAVLWTVCPCSSFGSLRRTTALKGFSDRGQIVSNLALFYGQFVLVSSFGSLRRSMAVTRLFRQGSDYVQFIGVLWTVCPCFFFWQFKTEHGGDKAFLTRVG